MRVHCVAVFPMSSSFRIAARMTDIPLRLVFVFKDARVSCGASGLETLRLGRILCK